ncbi:hypothetical protein JCM8202v2_001058 [Rhodotorula sphaerocarpa]
MTRCRWCYGLAIPTTSLIIAARAWPRVKRAFRFIDLISARKKAGTLAVGMKMFSSSLFQLIMGMLADHKLQIPCVQV